MSIYLFFELFFRALQIAWEWFYGCWRLNRVEKPIISIFGGKGLDQDSVLGKQVYELARQLVDDGYFIITGGGPGAMEAAHCGAFAGSIKDKNDNSLGIGVRGVDPAFRSLCSRDMLRTSFFFVRKWLLTHFSVGVVVFPGGYGTADELFEVLNLLKLGKIPAIPVVLVGTDYWQPMVTWVDNAIAYGLIQPQFKKLFVVVQATDEIMHALGAQDF